MEDSVVTTRSLQWGQRILTAATDKFQKRAYAYYSTKQWHLQYNILKPPWSYPEGPQCP